MLSLPWVSLLIKLAVHILIKVENIKNRTNNIYEIKEKIINSIAKLDVIDDFKVLLSIKNSKKLYA